MNKPFFQKLEKAGAAWVLECLENGGSFSKVVLSKIDINRGTVQIAIATPEHQEAVQSHQSLNNGYAKVGVWFSLAVQTTLLYQELKQLDEKQGPLAIVVEDDITQGNPVAEKSQANQLFKNKDQLLNIKNVSNIDTADVLSSHLSRSVGYPLNAFVIPQSVIPDQKDLSESVADNMAISVLGIINSAYDGETYTLWTKESTS